MMQGGLLGLLLAGYSMVALAQLEPAIPSVDTKAQRANIEQLRQQKSAELDQEDAACMARFAVADCQSKVGLRRRQMLAELKLQETSLNVIERQQKQQEQLLLTQQKTLDSAQRQQKAKAEAEKNQSIDRQQILGDKRRTHQEQAQSVRANAPTNKADSRLDAAVVQKNREAYLEKQKALEKRRQERDRRLIDQSKTVAPLPLPP